MLRQLVAPRSLALWVAFAAAGNREATGQALAAADSAAVRPPSPPADSAFADSSAGPRLWRVQAGIRPEAAAVDVDAMHKQDADPTGWAAAVLNL
jgi:hypothetical protein